MHARRARQKSTGAHELSFFKVRSDRSPISLIRLVNSIISSSSFCVCVCVCVCVYVLLEISYINLSMYISNQVIYVIYVT
jgi:hypothetical protein